MVLPEFANGVVEGPSNGNAMAIEAVGRQRRPYAARAALEQGDTMTPLDLEDAPGDARLRGGFTLGRTRHGPFFIDGDERTNQA